MSKLRCKTSHCHSSRSATNFGDLVATDMADGQQQTPQVPVSQGAAGQQPGPDQVVDDVWGEERLEKAMNTLKEMHIQVSR